MKSFLDGIKSLGRSDYCQSTLDALKFNLAPYLETPKIAEVIAETLIKSLNPQKIAILTRNSNDSCYVIRISVGFSEDDCSNLLRNCFPVTYTEERNQIYLLDKIKKELKVLSEDNQRKMAYLISGMERSGAAVVVPILNSGRLIALVILGGRNNGKVYGDLEVNLLDVVATQAAVSLENALLYSQIYTLNQQLQQKISRATQELKEKNDQLREALERVESLDKLKDQLISITSHELRTPLSAIKSYLWMALYKSDSRLSERMTRYISRAYQSSERMIGLVNDILNVSRLEAGRIEISPKVFEVNKLIKDVVSEIEPKSSEKQISIELSKQLPPKVFADPDKVREIALNLLINALKFTSSGGKITVGYLADGESVEINISDNGIGIAKEDQNRLFTRFGRLDNSFVTTSSEGTGLGLYICKSLVELMGGEIWAASDGLSKGSTFTFSLPTATPKVLAEAEKFTRAVQDQPKSLEPVSFNQ